MGRPNWTRTLAYSVAVSRHHRAPPACSAAIRAHRPPGAPARLVEEPSCPPGVTTDPPSTSTASTRRVGSRLARGTPARTPTPSSVLEHTPAPTDPSTARAGATSEDAVPAPRTGLQPRPRPRGHRRAGCCHHVEVRPRVEGHGSHRRPRGQSRNGSPAGVFPGPGPR